MPVLVAGLTTCLLLEKPNFRPWRPATRARPRHLVEFDQHEASIRTGRDNARLVVQAVAALFLVFALAFHAAEVGLIGLTIIVLHCFRNRGTPTWPCFRRSIAIYRAISRSSGSWA